MATTVLFGPPPLPPNKKSLLTASGHLRQRKHHPLPPFSPPLSLSSTYMSFRDPSDDEDPLQLEEKPFSSKPASPSIMRTASVNTNSLRRSVRNCNYSFNNSNRLDAPKLTLMRSQSEGNLAAVSRKLSTFDKCIKVLSGSWKNLLQRKLT